MIHEHTNKNVINTNTGFRSYTKLPTHYEIRMSSQHFEYVLSDTGHATGPASGNGVRVKSNDQILTDIQTNRDQYSICTQLKIPTRTRTYITDLDQPRT